MFRALQREDDQRRRGPGRRARGRFLGLDHPGATARVARGDTREKGAGRQGAFYLALVPIRPRRRGERRSLRTFPGASLRPGSLAFNPRPRRLSTPTDAFELHPDNRSYGRWWTRRTFTGRFSTACETSSARIRSSSSSRRSIFFRAGRTRRSSKTGSSTRSWRSAV
eukprot:31459-Pelagococcus_subviridis.AAC.8